MAKYLTKTHEEFIRRCLKHNIETNISKRWESGRDHHPKSEELMSNLECADWLYGDDFFGWKIGGDGDNGEFLMYELDIIFELMDKERGE